MRGHSRHRPPTDRAGTGSTAHRWFAEFDEEELHERERVSAATAAAARQRTIALPRPAAASHRLAQAECRRRDETEADAFWVEAQQHKRVAAALLDLQFYPSSVWHSQQAVEMAVKSLMLRTCGVTDGEMKGSTGHDVHALIGKVIGSRSQSRQPWPVPRGELEQLSAAYLAARYPRGWSSTTRPSSLYREADARRALEVASLLKEWAVMSSSAMPSTDAQTIGVAKRTAARLTSPQPTSSSKRPRLEFAQTNESDPESYVDSDGLD